MYKAPWVGCMHPSVTIEVIFVLLVRNHYLFHVVCRKYNGEWSHGRVDYHAWIAAWMKTDKEPLCFYVKLKYNTIYWGRARPACIKEFVNC